jgi:Uma2 family endonuclease
VKQRPDWICEVVSPGDARRDTVRKLRLYHRLAVPYYWLVDPVQATLTVLRWSEAGYLTLLTAERGENVRAEPFEAIEIAVGTLFGDDPP